MLRFKTVDTVAEKHSQNSNDANVNSCYFTYCSSDTSMRKVLGWFGSEHAVVLLK